MRIRVKPRSKQSRSALESRIPTYMGTGPPPYLQWQLYWQQEAYRQRGFYKRSQRFWKLLEERPHARFYSHKTEVAA